MKQIITIGLVLCGLAICAQVWATPLPTSNDVQRVTPSRCPIDTIPVVNSQGTSGAAVQITTHAIVVQGKPTRQIYGVISDADFCGEYGSANNAAPTTEPVGGSPCSAGILYKANIFYWQDVFPTNRFDGACASGTCNVYSVECVP
jgi:hypothetical protein